MRSGRVWGARLAALVVAIIVPACNNSGSGTGTTSSLWISNSGTGGQPTGTPMFWRDPNLAVSNLYVPDPFDIRTYTRPDIWILGNNHPLMTDIQAKTFPNIVFNEERAMTLVNQQRNLIFIQILGKPLPPTLHGVLTDHTGLRQNARAHCKHYAQWLPQANFPPGGAPNEEGDRWWDPVAIDRLERSGLTVAGGYELTAAGLQYRSGDDVAAYWIANYCQGPPTPGAQIPPNQYLLWVPATHMSVGFWQLGGTKWVYYWCLIIAKDPNTAVTLPTIPFGGPGF